MAKTTKKPAPTSKGARKTSTQPPTNGAVPAVSIATNQPITDADIAARAFEIYLSRGAHHGLDLEDWLEAESSLRKDGA